ncbi:MAG: glycosyltransferase [Saprospiraceae bacterium]|nr:glycosyltransferase [Saprospiraceae bacterium]
MPKKIVVLITSNFDFDQRMQRIVNTMTHLGYKVTVLSPYVSDETNGIDLVRLMTFFKKGKGFYLVYNLLAFVHVLFNKNQIIYTVDMDTAWVGYFYKKIFKCCWILDMHEYFSEMPEIAGSLFVKNIWAFTEKMTITACDIAISVSPSLQSLLELQFKRKVWLVRSLPYLQDKASSKNEHTIKEKVIIYQGALNEGRGLEYLVDIWAHMPPRFTLALYGEGTISNLLKRMVKDRKMDDQVKFYGKLKPDQLKNETQNAWLGLNLLSNRDLNSFHSLANKFFDYVQAEIPQITHSFPNYKLLNEEFEVAALLKYHDQSMIDLILELEKDEAKYQYLKSNTFKAKKVWNWQNEEKVIEKILEQSGY